VAAHDGNKKACRASTIFARHSGMRLLAQTRNPEIGGARFRARADARPGMTERRFDIVLLLMKEKAILTDVVQVHLICPFCKPRVQPLSQKKFWFSESNHFIDRSIPSHREGRFAIVTNVGTGCDGRGGAFDERRSSGRRSRVVLTPRRWRQVPEKQASQGRRWQESRSPGRARRKPLKPLRGECRVIPV